MADTMIDDAPNTKDIPAGRASQRRKPKTVKRSGGSSRPTPRPVGTTTKRTIPASRAFLSGRVQNPERVIALELIVTVAVYIGVSLYEEKVPEPKVIAIILAVYAILGLVTIFGARWGRVAYLLGGLVLLGALFNKEVQMASNKLGLSKGTKNG